MRLTLFPTTIALLLATLSASAASDAFLSGGIGIHRFGIDEFQDGAALSAAAGVSGVLTPVLDGQAEVSLAYIRTDFDTSIDTRLEFDGALHVFKREPGAYLLGGLVQLGLRNETIEIEDETESASATTAWAGLEGQAYLDGVTLYGQFGVMKAAYERDDPFTFTGLFASAEVRYFLTDNFRVDVHGLAVSMRSDQYDGGQTTWGAGIGAEYRLADTPVSVFGTADLFRSAAGLQEFGDARIMVGLKFNIGSETLLERDRNGASLKPAPQIPLYGLALLP